jgi:hypothetical protein
MARYNICKECKVIHWDNEPCPPEFTVIYEDYTGEEGTKVRAHDHENAAEKFAIDYDSGEYDLLNSSIDVFVIGPDGSRKGFTVSAQQSIDYTAKERKFI